MSSNIASQLREISDSTFDKTLTNEILDTIIFNAKEAASRGEIYCLINVPEKAFLWGFSSYNNPKHLYIRKRLEEMGFKFCVEYSHKDFEGIDRETIAIIKW